METRKIAIDPETRCIFIFTFNWLKTNKLCDYGVMRIFKLQLLPCLLVLACLLLLCQHLQNIGNSLKSVYFLNCNLD